MAIDHHPVAALAPQQLVERHARQLGLDIPQRHVDRRDRAHRHRAAPPIGAAIEILPDVLGIARVHAKQAGDDVVFQIGHNRLLAPVQRRIADAVNPLVGLDLQRHEIAPRAGDDDAGGGDLHSVEFLAIWPCDPALRSV